MRRKRQVSVALAPAAARGASPVISLEEADLSQQAVAVFERVLGGRDQFAAVLAVADDSPEVAKVNDFLLDPRYQSLGLRKICAMAGLTVADLFAAYRKAVIVQAHLEAAPIIAKKLVGVVDDLMTRAQPHYLPCDTCRGTGRVVPPPTKDQPAPEPVACTACVNGQQLHLPDLDRQKLALEIAELIKPRAGVTFNQANVLAPPDRGPSVTGSLEQLQQAVSEVLFSGRPMPVTDPPIDADVVEPSADAAR